MAVPKRNYDKSASQTKIPIPFFVNQDRIAPEYQGWFVNLKDVSNNYGREIGQERNGVQMVMLDGNEQRYRHLGSDGTFIHARRLSRIHVYRRIPRPHRLSGEFEMIVHRLNSSAIQD